MDLAGLIGTMNQSGAFTRIVNNPISRMAEPDFPYLGATLLPPRNVPQNIFTEQNIRYRTVIANDSGRYNPVQLKQGMIVGEMLVQLAEIDTGSEMTSQDYDAVIDLLNRTQGTQGSAGGDVPIPAMQAMAQTTRWADMTLNRPINHKMEKQRWEAIVNASVVRTGDNGYTETVTFPSPTGHRPNVGGDWDSDSYDPYTDIIAGAEVLAAKGYTVNRIITSTTVRSKLSVNEKVQLRTGRISVASGVVTGIAGRVTLDVLNNMIGADGLPNIEIYDRQYRTQTSFARFLPNSVFVMVATTGRDESIDLGDEEPLNVRNTLGYQAIGRAAGQSAPGVATHIEAKTDKPPRIEGQVWATTFPVITDPEAVFVLNNIV